MEIYKITNSINGKIYIGKACQKSTLRKGYLGSGKLIRRAVAKYGQHAFSKEILEIVDDKKLLEDREKYWIAFYKAKDISIGYNICDGGEGGCGGDTLSNHPNKEEICKKISNSRKGQSSFWKGKELPLEIRQKISISKMGVKPSEETRKKLSLAKLGNKNSVGRTPWNKGLKMPFMSRRERKNGS